MGKVLHTPGSSTSYVSSENPYQSPVPEDFLDERSREYELALGGFEHMVNLLRDRIAQLEAELVRSKEENFRLTCKLASPKPGYMRPPVISFFGFQMEGSEG